MQGGTQKSGKKYSLKNGVYTTNLPSIVLLYLFLLLPVIHLFCVVCAVPHPSYPAPPVFPVLPVSPGVAHPNVLNPTSQLLIRWDRRGSTYRSMTLAAYNRSDQLANLAGQR